MLAERTVNRFNGAVRECLEDCYQSANPLACLATYLERLRADKWNEAEIEEVETVVRRLLLAVVQPEAIQPKCEC
jgi:hypothetical protein